MTRLNLSGIALWPADKRAPREGPPPSRWLRSVGGAACGLVSTTLRNAEGEKLYRLMYLDPPVVIGDAVWTVQDLIASGCRFLKNRPRVRAIEKVTP